MTFARPVAGGGGSFDPLSLSPALWLDASDSSTLYDAVTGGSLVAADGLVARWEDKSGNGRHATQATSGLRPQRKTSVINSKDILRFNRNGMVFASAPISSGSGTAIYVTKAVNDPPALGDDAGAPLGDFGSDGQANHFPWVDGNVYDDFGSTARKNLGNPTLSLASWRVCSQLSATNNYTAWLNGSLIFTTATNTTGWSSSPKIGYVIGGATYYFLGDIVETLLYPTALSTIDRQAVESYLASKYAITF
jgi:hypothetical protein